MKKIYNEKKRLVIELNEVGWLLDKEVEITNWSTFLLIIKLNKMNKLLKVDIYINQDKAEFKIKELEIAKETDKTFKIKNGVINKSKLGICDSIFRNVIYSESSTLSYFTYCLPKNLESAKQTLYSQVKYKISNLSIGLMNLDSSFSSLEL